MVLALLLAGCGGDRLDQVESRITTLEQQQLALAALDARLQALETVPKLQFDIADYQLNLEEQMFQPILKTSARLMASGDTVPHTFYVDMLLQVEVPSEGFVSMNRQVFPVFEGKSRIELMQPLPVHGLSMDQIKVTLRPMNWYGSHRIAEDKVTYRK